MNFDLSDCEKHDGYYMWTPRKRDSTENKPAQPPPEKEPPKAAKIQKYVCHTCGQISFVDMEKCGWCKKPFKSKKQKKPARKKPSRRRNMNFEDFERNKRLLNKLNYEWMEALVLDPEPKALIKSLENKISALRQKLSDNIHLAFIFNYE